MRDETDMSALELQESFVHGHCDDHMRLPGSPHLYPTKRHVSRVLLLLHYCVAGFLLVSASSRTAECLSQYKTHCELDLRSSQQTSQQWEMSVD